MDIVTNENGTKLHAVVDSDMQLTFLELIPNLDDFFHFPDDQGIIPYDAKYTDVSISIGMITNESDDETAINKALACNKEGYDVYIPIHHIGKTSFYVKYWLALESGQEIAVKIGMQFTTPLSVKIGYIETTFFTEDLTSNYIHFILEDTGEFESELEWTRLSFWNGISMEEPVTGQYSKEHKGIQLHRDIVQQFRELNHQTFVQDAGRMGVPEDDVSIDTVIEKPAEFEEMDHVPDIPIYDYSIRQMFMTLVTQWGLSIRYYDVLSRILSQLHPKFFHPEQLVPVVEDGETVVGISFEEDKTDRKCIKFRAFSKEEELTATFLYRMSHRVTRDLTYIGDCANTCELFLLDIVATEKYPSFEDPDCVKTNSVSFYPASDKEMMDSIEELWVTSDGRTELDGTHMFMENESGESIRENTFPIIWLDQYLSVAPLVADNAKLSIHLDGDVIPRNDFVLDTINKISEFLYSEKLEPLTDSSANTSQPVLEMMLIKIRNDLSTYQFTNERASFRRALDLLVYPESISGKFDVFCRPEIRDLIFNELYTTSSDTYDTALENWNALLDFNERPDVALPITTSAYISPLDLNMMLDSFKRCDIDGDTYCLSDGVPKAFNLKAMSATKYPDKYRIIKSEKED